MQNMNINVQALLLHISNELYTNIHFLENNNDTWITCAQKIEAEDPYFKKQEIRYSLISGSFTKFNPTFVQINTSAVYSVIYCPHGIYIVGPVLLPADIHCLNQIDIHPCAQDFTPHIRYVSLTKYATNIFLLYNVFHESPMTLESYLSQEQFTSKLIPQMREDETKLTFDNRELEHKHNPFDNELRDLKAIEEGRLDQFDQVWRDNSNLENLSVVSQNPVRNAKYLAIMAITLGSRAAIRGGVLPETALSLCDSYILQIDKLIDISQLESIASDAWHRFAYLVSEQNALKADQKTIKNHPAIEQSKDYVFHHLHEKITIAQVAEALHLNTTYLTNLFKKHEGISLYQFILNEKINLVKNLLTYSQYSYIEIANYLGFASQSHLSQVFKNATGMTLKQFRDNYGKKGGF